MTWVGRGLAVTLEVAPHEAWVRPAPVMLSRRRSQLLGSLALPADVSLKPVPGALTHVDGLVLGSGMLQIDEALHA